jgi:hypothetical protein
MPKKGPKNNKAHRSMDVAAVASKLYKRLSKSPGRRFSLDDLAVDVGLPHEQGRPLVRSALELLVRTQQAVEGPANVFRLFFEERFVEGKLDLTQSGTGYITGTGLPEDVFVRDTHTGVGLNGDWVKVLLFAAPAPDARAHVRHRYGSEAATLHRTSSQSLSPAAFPARVCCVHASCR